MKPLNNQTIGDIIKSIVIGNNVRDSVIVVVINIGHTTYGDNSHIEGDISVNVPDGNDNKAVAGNSNQS